MTVEGMVPFIPSHPGSAAGAAFNHIAQEYDQIFTDSLIGRAQRDARLINRWINGAWEADAGSVQPADDSTVSAA